ncbi:hypothetical protein A4X09_0g633 [Tilletia walkeri]|uniref:Uncharacterized protein n=1 Tax=Tilletia walkeri TaxID=117179 RepID=A0A8X7T7V2_9BASI|nr:hypothetical protein A4X09_0g633 [Tilletia walkeri]
MLRANRGSAFGRSEKPALDTIPSHQHTQEQQQEQQQQGRPSVPEPKFKARRVLSVKYRALHPPSGRPQIASSAPPPTPTVVTRAGNSTMNSPASPVQGSPAPSISHGTRSRGNTFTALIGSIRRSGSRSNLKDSAAAANNSSMSNTYSHSGEPSSGSTRGHGGSGSTASTSMFPALGLGIREFGSKSAGNKGRGGSFGSNRMEEDDGYVPYNGPVEPPPAASRFESTALDHRLGGDLLPPIQASFGPTFGQQLRASAAFSPPNSTYDTEARSRSLSASTTTAQRAGPARNSPQPKPNFPPPSSPLPSLPTTPAFVFPRSSPRQPNTTPTASQALSPSPFIDETPRQMNAMTMAQRYSQPYSRPAEASARGLVPWALPPIVSHRPASPKLPDSSLMGDVENFHRRPSIGTGLPTAYIHSSADRPTNLDTAPYLPAALAFDRSTNPSQPALDASNLNAAAFRPAIVGWAKPATTSYPMGSQPDGHRDLYSSPAKSGLGSQATSSVHSGHSSEALDASYHYSKDHPYDRSAVGGHSAQTSMTSLRTFPSSGGAHGAGSKARSHGGTPSSQRHRRGEHSFGHGSASSAAGLAYSESAAASSVHGGTASSAMPNPASLSSVSSEDIAQLENSARAAKSLGSGPASKSVSAGLATGRKPRNVASVPDLRAPPIVKIDVPEPQTQSGDSDLVEVTTSPNATVSSQLEPKAAEIRRVETPTGSVSMLQDLASHRPQAPLSPIPSSLASPNTGRLGEESSPSARELNSNNGDVSTPFQSSRSNGSRSDSNITTSASPGRRQEQGRARQLVHNEAAPRTPSPQDVETASMRERNMAKAKFHLLQQLHLEELILHSVEFAGVLEPASGCDAVFRPRPTLKSRGSDPSRRYQVPSLPERSSASSSGHGTHSTVGPLEAGFERHRARPGSNWNTAQAHRRTKTEGMQVDTGVPVHLAHLFGTDQRNAALQSGRQPFFHHRMPPEPPGTVPKQSAGPVRSAAALVATPVAWCSAPDDVSVAAVSEFGTIDSAPKFATLPIEKRPQHTNGEVELVYRMRSMPVGAQQPVTPETPRERKRSTRRLRKQPSTPDLTHSGSSPEIDELETPDLSTVIAEGVWLDEQRAKWREQYRKSLDASPAIASWRRRSRSRSRSMSRTLNELPRGAEPTFYDQYRKNGSSHDDAALDPRGGVLAKLQGKYKGSDASSRGRVARQAIDDDRKFREKQQDQTLRHSRSSPQLRRLADERRDAPLPPLPTSSRRAPAGVGLNQEAELSGNRSESPEIPTSFQPFSRRRVASLGKDSARKAAALEKAHRRNRSASLSPERLSNQDLAGTRSRKQSLIGLFSRKNRSPVGIRTSQPYTEHRYRNSTASASRKRVHRNSASWDRAVQTDSPVHLTGEERLKTLQTEKGTRDSKFVVTDVPVVIATSNDNRRSTAASYSGQAVPSRGGTFQFPGPSGGAIDGHLTGLAIGSPPASQVQDSIIDAYSSEAPALTTAGRHPTTPSYHRQTDSSDLRAMLRNAHRQESEMSDDYGTGLASLPAPPRRRVQPAGSEGRHDNHGRFDLPSASAQQPRTPLQQHPFNTPQFTVPPTPLTGAAFAIQERSTSALSGSDRATPVRHIAGSHSGSAGSGQREPNGPRSGSSADSYDTRPGSGAREVWMMDSESREEEDEAQFQGLFFMPPRSEGSIPRSPHIRDGRPMGSLSGSRVTLGLQREAFEQIDDEVEDSAEEMQPISEEQFHQLGASRASSGISHQIPILLSSGSSPGEEKLRDDSPIEDTTSTIGHSASLTPFATRQGIVPDSFTASSSNARIRSPSTTSSAAAAASVQGGPGVRVGHVAATEQIPQVVERSSMSRSSSSTGQQRRFRRGPAGSTASDSQSLFASTFTDEFPESIMVHPNTSAVEEADLDDGEEGPLREGRLLSFASHVGEVGMYEDDLGTPRP